MIRLAVLALLLLTAQVWAEAAWTSLKARTETVKIEGQKVELGIAPAFRIAGSALELQLKVDLADFQRKAPAILKRLADRKSKKCGLRWSFPNLAAPKFGDAKLRVAGKVRVEQRACAFGANERVWRETASFAMSVIPVARDNRVRFEAMLEEFDLGKSVLKGIGADREVRLLVETAVRRLMADDDLSVEFPKEVRDLKPQLTRVALEGDRLVVAAKAEVGANTMQELVKLLLKP